MRNELLIIIVGAIVVLSASAMLFYNFMDLSITSSPSYYNSIINDEGNSITGNVISNYSFNSYIPVSELNVSLDMEQARVILNDSELIIKDMEGAGFFVQYQKDLLSEANRKFEQARYSEMLYGKLGASAQELSQARASLRFVDLRNSKYSDILPYTNEIRSRRETAILLSDMLFVEEQKVNISKVLSNETIGILNGAKNAFYEERYNDTQKLIGEFRISYESDVAEAYKMNVFSNNAQNFIKRNWIQIIIVLAGLSLFGIYLYNSFKAKNLREKIRKMKIKKKVLVDLIKSAQEDRFKRNLISGLVYDLRMRKYKEELNEIDEQLPVLESKLKK